VVIQRQQTTATGESETVLEIRGRKLRALLAEKQAQRLFVSGTAGQPATIVAREVRLSGTQVHLDQAANRLWIDGAGEMQLTPDTDGGPSGLPRLEVTPVSAPGLLASGTMSVAWQGGMVFDGQQLYFETGVTSQSRQASGETGNVDMTATRSAALSIVLNRRTDFQQDPQAIERNDLRVERLVMVGWMDVGHAAFPATHQPAEERHAWISGARYDAAGQLVSTHEILAPRASFDAVTGHAECEGPGSLLVRQSSQGTNGSTPVMPVSTGRRGGTIDLIRIRYDERFSGSLEERRFRFRGNVHTFYTDCLAWDELPAESVIRNEGRQGLVLDCDELDLVQWTPAGREPVIDLTATGNARVKGSQFDADAERISYFEGNNVVTVEAPTRGDAELLFERPAQPGQPAQSGRGRLVAKRIVYNLATGTWEVDQMRQMDYEDQRSQESGGRRQQAVR
jgi:hypothetical protein